MRRKLELHEDCICAAVKSIDVHVHVERPRPTGLRLRYVVSGRIDGVRVPSPASPTRVDELWKHTCFEAFVKGLGDAYCEFNFSPSTQWAAYAFGGYRTDMRIAEEVSAATTAMESDAARLEVQVSLALDGLKMLPADVDWRLGLSAVIEETNGRKSYWALAHPPGKPDFHHSDCFVLTLPSASRS